MGSVLPFAATNSNGCCLSQRPLLGGLDEPETLSYQITLFGPISADVRQFREVGPDHDGNWNAQIWTGKYRRRHVDLRRFFDATRFIEDADERINEADMGAGEGGQRNPIDELTRQDIDRLQEAVQSAIWHWQHRRGIMLRGYYMELVEGGTFVTRPHPEDNDKEEITQ